MPTLELEGPTDPSSSSASTASGGASSNAKESTLLRALSAERALRERAQAELSGVKQQAELLGLLLVKSEARFDALLQQSADAWVEQHQQQQSTRGGAVGAEAEGMEEETDELPSAVSGGAAEGRSSSSAAAAADGWTAERVARMRLLAAAEDTSLEGRDALGLSGLSSSAPAAAEQDGAAGAEGSGAWPPSALLFDRERHEKRRKERKEKEKEREKEKAQQEQNTSDPAEQQQQPTEAAGDAAAAPASAEAEMDESAVLGAGEEEAEQEEIAANGKVMAHENLPVSATCLSSVGLPRHMTYRYSHSSPSPPASHIESRTRARP